MPQLIFRPAGAGRFLTSYPRLARGLHSCAASRLFNEITAHFFSHAGWVTLAGYVVGSRMELSFGYLSGWGEGWYTRELWR